MSAVTILTFSALVAAGSVLAGLLGALTGLGGGIVIVPLLTLGFGVDIRYAIGASLVSVIATSSGAAAAFVREGYSNIRIGMFLEVATTVGALANTHRVSSRDSHASIITTERYDNQKPEALMAAAKLLETGQSSKILSRSSVSEP